MITFNNYNEATKQINWNTLPDVLKRTHTQLMPDAQAGAYAGDTDVKRVVDSYISKLNAALAKQEPVKDEIIETIKEVFPGVPKLVERISDEIALINRYINFHGKNKSRDQVYSLLKAIQKAILEKRVNKTSQYGKEVMQMQDSLLAILKHDVKSYDITIDAKNLKKYKSIVTSVAPMSSIQLLKRYVSLQNKAAIVDKATRLRDAIHKNMNASDKYYSYLVIAGRNLNSYIEISKTDKNETLRPFSDVELKGLGFVVPIISAVAASATGAAVHALTTHHLKKKKNGLGSVAEPNPDKPTTGVMSIDDIHNSEFKTIGLTGDLLALIGDACKPTSIMFSGKGGSGKSTEAYRLAEFCNCKGDKVLVVAAEEYNTPTLQNLLVRLKLNINKNTFHWVKDINQVNPADYDWIMLDSKDSCGFTHSDQFEAFKQKYHKQSFILTSKATKDGRFKGDGGWQNVVDTLVNCEATQEGLFAEAGGEKNRWGGKGRIKIK